MHSIQIHSRIFFIRFDLTSSLKENEMKMMIIYGNPVASLVGIWVVSTHTKHTAMFTERKITALHT